MSSDSLVDVGMGGGSTTDKQASQDDVSMVDAGDFLSVDGGPDRDLHSRLASSYSRRELRRRARREGVHYDRGADRDELARRLVDDAPYAARDMLGMT